MYLTYSQLCFCYLRLARFVFWGPNLSSDPRAPNLATPRIVYPLVI